MSYEDRVMTRLVNVRQHLELLQHRLMTSGIDKLTLLGEQVDQEPGEPNAAGTAGQDR